MNRTFYFLSLAIGLSISAEGSDILVSKSKTTVQKLPDVVSFNAHIRPVMSNTCFACHGPDEEDNESGYRIDSFDNATKALPSDDQIVGIKPHAPEASEVYLRITGKSEGEQMPPREFRHQLSDYDKALFEKWIAQGATYEQHWSYTPIKQSSVPVTEKHADKIDNPIDSFVVARLEEEGLSPSPTADKATLLRRLSLDLIGLPPTPEELQRFLADTSKGAYETEVNRLISSEHFGERMASSWLDLVRFADTVGFHGDQNQRIFPYRDYVINAFNKNMPFDQFTREQIAGDLLPNPTEEQLIATGFLRLNMMTREGGAQPKEYLAKYRADRVRSIGTAWLGSTLGCCECHNHKYDPFTAKDFYSLGAFFDDLRQWGVYSEYQYTPNPDLRAFTNDYPFPPEIRIESPVLKTELERLARERDDRLLMQLGDVALESDDFESWLVTTDSFARKHADGWIAVTVDSADASGPTKVENAGDGTLLFSGEAQKDEQTTVNASVKEATAVNSIRVEVLPDEIHNNLVGRSSEGRFSLSLKVFIVDLKVINAEPANADKDEQATSEKPVKIAWAQADRQAPKKYSNGAEALFLEQPWLGGLPKFQVPANETSKPHTAVFHFDKPIELLPNQQLKIVLSSGDIGKIRLSFTPIGHAFAGMPALTESLRNALKTAIEFNQAAWDQSTQATLVSAWHRSTVPIAKQHELSRYYRDEMLKRRSGSTMSLIAQSISADKIPVSKVLPRGNWQDENGELAPPGVPHFLPQPKSIHQEGEPARRLTRLDLADWITSKENPLTPRHFVNRTWKHFFGMGLSAKLDDLGSQGEWPSHPLLLNWLAAEFVESGWDMQHVIKLIVTSRAYRQSAAIRTDLSEIDPYNRLLSQQSPRRLEAEAIRDNALAISGLLSKDYIGGPSVSPYQPDEYYSNLQFPGRKYIPDRDYRQYRRGVYMHWQRTFLHPMLVNFDAPSRDECAADRPQSNSPQQALTLLNDPTFVEASIGMTRRLLAEKPDASFDAILDHAFVIALARKPSGSEKQALANLFQTQQSYYDQHPDEVLKLLSIGLPMKLAEGDLAEQAAWTQVCRVILNLHETITRY